MRLSALLEIGKNESESDIEHNDVAIFRARATEALARLQKRIDLLEPAAAKTKDTPKPPTTIAPPTGGVK